MSLGAEVWGLFVRFPCPSSAVRAMACVLRACTCHFVEPHAKGCCSFPRTTHMCAFCVHTGNFICGYLCCFCIASFQNAVQKNKLKTIKSLLFCLPANVGSGVSLCLTATSIVAHQLDNLQDLFFRAIEENRPRVIKMLIKNGGNPNIMMVRTERVALPRP